MILERPIIQPLHAEIRDRLDPEYVSLHDEVIQYVPTNESLPWTPDLRSRPSPMAHLNQTPVEVGSVEDYAHENFQARVFTPDGQPPPNGWPILMWLHGGGFVMGGLNSENGYLRHICKCR